MRESPGNPNQTYSTKRLPLGLSARAVITNDAGQVLVVKRSIGSRHFPGEWEFPGGKIEPGESLDRGLLREALEETGLEIQFMGSLGVEDLVLPDVRVVTIFVRGCANSGKVEVSKEHDSARWLSWNELGSLLLAPPSREFHRRFRQGFPELSEDPCATI